MSDIKFNTVVHTSWTFKLARKTVHIRLHEWGDVQTNGRTADGRTDDFSQPKFLVFIDNQIFLSMVVRSARSALSHTVALN